MSKVLRGIVGIIAIGVAFIPGIGTALSAALWSMGASLLIGAILEPSVKNTRRLQQQSVMIRSAVQPQDVAYGRDKKSGVIVWFDTSGTDNKYLWFVVAVVEHEIDGYEKLWIDDVEIDIATEIDGSGYVTHANFKDGDGTKLVKTAFYEGLDSQTADAELVAEFGDWTTDHKGEGVAYFWVRLEQDKSKGGTDPENPTANVWHKGYPRELAVTARWSKVYDPALDDLNGGTGSHRVDTASTWEWSQNSILCRADYLRSSRFGPGYTSSEVDWPTIITQAAIADVLVDIPNSETQSRYELNGVISTADTPKSILESMQTADYGTTLFNASGLSLLVGAWDASSHTIDESWITGLVAATSATPTDGAYNAVRGQFLSADEDYTLVEFSPRLSSAYETEDGVGRIWEDIVLPFTSNEYQAQRLAIITLKKSRQQTTVNMQCNYRAELIELYQVVTLDLPGFSSDTFRVIGKATNQDGTASFNLREEVSTDWDYTVPDLSEPPVVPTITRNPAGVPAPAALTASTVVDGIQLVWSSPDMTAISHIEIYAATTNDRSLASKITQIQSESFFYELAESEVRYFWILARGNNNMTSTWHPVSEPDTGLDGVEGTAGGAGDGLSIVELSIYKRATSTPATPTGGSYDFDTTTLTPPAGWTSAIPAGDDPIYVCRGVASITGITGTDTSITWSAAIKSTESGSSVDIIFQAAASQPSTPADSSGVPAGWYSDVGSVPASDDPIWSSVGTRDNAGNNWTWQTPLKIEGSDAISGWITPSGPTAWVRAVDQSTWTPTATTVDLDCTFSVAGVDVARRSMRVTRDASGNLTDALTTHPDGDLNTSRVTVNTTSGGQIDDISFEYSYGIHDLTVTQTVTTTLSGSDGGDGGDGNDGLSVHVANIYRRDSSAPATPTADAGSYNFTTTTLTPPGPGTTPANTLQWFIAPPAGTDPLYVSTGTFSISGATGTDSTVTWTSPDVLVSDGESGDTIHVANIYIRSATTPATPTADDGSYNFDTQTLTPAATPAQWYITPPTGGLPLYVSSGTFSVTGNTGTDSTVTWSSPDLLISDGITVIVSHESHTMQVSSAGVIDYTGSGTTIKVWEGANQVPHDNVSTYDSPSFRVSTTSVVDITPATGYESATYTWRYDDHSAMTADVASIGYLVTVKNVAGEEATFRKTQNFAKSTSALGSTVYNGFEAGNQFDAWEKDAGESGTLTADTTTVFAGSQAGLMGSSVASPVSTAKTGSHRFAIPAELAATFTGQTVTVSCVVRTGVANQSAEFAIAYATNDNGNSGWNAFTPTGTYTRYSFDYVVPDPVAGGQHWIGVHPDTSGGNVQNLLVDDITVAIKGTDGGDGNSVYVANVFLRASSAPATPTEDSGEYNFSTNTLTPPDAPVQWYTTPQAGTDPLYVSSGSFSVSGSTGTDSTVVWTSPDLMVSDGGDGDSVHVANIYRRDSSAPATPTEDAGQYSFTTKELTPPGPGTSPSNTLQWFITPPDVDGDPLYVSTGTFAVNGTTGVDSTVVWSSPDLLVQDGDDAITWDMSNQSPGITADQDGTVTDLSNTGTTLTMKEGETDLTFTTAALTAGEFRVLNRTTRSPTGITLGAITGNGTATATAAVIGAWTDTTDLTGYVEWSVSYIRIAGGDTINFTIRRSFTVTRNTVIPTVDAIDLRSTYCGFGSGTITMKYKVDADGKIYGTTAASTYSEQYTYLNSGANTDYQVKMIKTSASPPGTGLTSGTLDAWLDCSTDREWTLTGSLTTWSGTVSIRDKTTGLILDTGSVTLDANTS